MSRNRVGGGGRWRPRGGVSRMHIFLSMGDVTERRFMVLTVGGRSSTTEWIRNATKEEKVVAGVIENEPRHRGLACPGGGWVVRGAPVNLSASAGRAAAHPSRPPPGSGASRTTPTKTFALHFHF